jgi:hypothetical protein
MEGLRRVTRHTRMRGGDRWKRSVPSAVEAAHSTPATTATTQAVDTEASPAPLALLILLLSERHAPPSVAVAALIVGLSVRIPPSTLDASPLLAAKPRRVALGLMCPGAKRVMERGSLLSPLCEAHFWNFFEGLFLKKKFWHPFFLFSSSPHGERAL